MASRNANQPVVIRTVEQVVLQLFLVESSEHVVEHVEVGLPLAVTQHPS